MILSLNFDQKSDFLLMTSLYFIVDNPNAAAAEVLNTDLNKI